MLISLILVRPCSALFTVIIYPPYGKTFGCVIITDIAPTPLQPPPGAQPHIPSDMGHVHALITVTCGYPPAQLLQHPIVVVNGSQPDSHPLIEGQFITYTCPPGFTLTGPNISLCTGNENWEPDPGRVDCIGE